jgi:hypothetical protein
MMTTSVRSLRAYFWRWRVPWTALLGWYAVVWWLSR